MRRGMTRELESALMDGETELIHTAESYEETAELDHLSWEASRQWYHTAGRKRLNARRLREVYHPHP